MSKRKANQISVEPQEILKVIKDTFTPTGNYEADKARVEAYAKAVNMDDLNKNLGVVLATQGPGAFLKQAYQNPHEPGKELSYSEMRALYG